MLFEILSTASLAGIAGSSYLLQNKNSNDHDKIKKIADAAGLKTKEGSIRIYRKVQKEGYAEYVYKIPLGLSFKQFEDNKQLFIDGLNNKSQSDINLKNFKNIDWKKDAIGQIRDIFMQRVKLDKQLEMEYDGMLRFKVYDQGLDTHYKLTKEILDSCNGWKVPLGISQTKTIFHDFEKAPHMLLGGTTDMGKSTTLNVIINSLIYNQPDNVKFTLLDLKGGLELGEYKSIKQTRNFAKDVAGALESLINVQNDMTEKFNTLERTGKKEMKDTNNNERHFVIIDEAAELSSHDETDKAIKKIKVECENLIKDIARRGRASGIRLIYSTQYPTTETISSQVKRNLITRICLPVDTSIASMVVLDEGGGEQLPLIQGRAIYKKHRKEVMQSFYIENDLKSKIIKPYIMKEDFNAGQKHKPKRKDSVKFETL